MAEAPPFAAVLWDFDGTLVDTEPLWIEAERALASECGATWSDDDALQLVGNDLLDSARYLIDRTGAPLTPAQVVDRLLDDVVVGLEQSVPWRPGARELLAELRHHGVPCGLVTMSYRRFVEPALARLPKDAFACVVTGDAVSRGKPHPDPYLRAAEMLGLAPAECLAIEDSNTGTASAEAAGCTVLVVPNHVTVPPGPGRILSEVLPGNLAALVDSVAPGGRPSRDAGVGAPAR